MIDRYLLEGERATLILGYEDYYITSYGRVFSAKKKVNYQTLNGVQYQAIVYKELNQMNIKGYKVVSLSRRKEGSKKFYIHDLVYRNFVGDFNKHYFQIKHINKKKEDNNLDNLALEFRKKDSKFIEKYFYQQKLLNCLNEY